MKKIIAALALLCVVAAGAFGQMINIRDYVSYFGFNDRDITSVDEYVGSAPRVERRVFSPLAGNDVQIDTPLEFAILSYYSQPVLNIRPAEADAILPANNPKLADQKLGAAVFQEIQILRFLGDTAAVNRHEAVLQFITGRGNATRAEIEAFYRNNVRALVSQVVDEEFAGITVPAVTVTYVKDSLTNFLTTPNQANYDTLKNIYKNIKSAVFIVPLIQNYENNTRGLIPIPGTLGQVAEEVYRGYQANYSQIRSELNIPNNAQIDWGGFESAYGGILSGLNTELARRMERELR